MNKYEIMLLVDIKADPEIGFSLVKSVFGEANVTKAEKLELTNLAYRIQKSEKAHYLLFEVNSESKNIAEFTRRSNILKEVLRQLVINLDTEKGYGKVRKVRAKKSFDKTNLRPRTNSQNTKPAENKESKAE
ncbi:30S ribosomal protein S6 [Mycoplasmopsis gallinarum]|uniref:30S ribosomal protein S6 n=1 Tax=Mycoplasmopsis gallinarum TaxID=29557 RepID=UPI0006872375|nr:30S ribosomal protein S6 [Mycoplasmopsis gallinarum]